MRSLLRLTGLTERIGSRAYALHLRNIPAPRAVRVCHCHGLSMPRPVPVLVPLPLPQPQRRARCSLYAPACQ